MKINDVIRTRRQALGLTQEALAEKLGVSAPAVNKWEKALNYPDITLLPALARTLGVDLNTLLSFQDDISQEQISQFLNELTETACINGSASAFQMARDKLLEFPNSDLLACNVASLLDGILVLYPDMDEEAAAHRKQDIDALYERTIHSTDPQVREWAVYMSAARCIGKKQLEQAECLLEQLPPDTYLNKKTLTASLRVKQGRIDEAWGLLEEELFKHANFIQTDLLQIVNLALESGEIERAQVYAGLAAKTGNVLHFPKSSALSISLQLALARKDRANVLAILEELLDSLMAVWDWHASPFYSHLPVKKNADTSIQLILRPLLDQLDNDPECQFLKEVPGYSELVEKYRKFAV